MTINDNQQSLKVVLHLSYFVFWPCKLFPASQYAQVMRQVGRTRHRSFFSSHLIICFTDSYHRERYLAHDPVERGVLSTEKARVIVLPVDCNHSHRSKSFMYVQR